MYHISLILIFLLSVLAFYNKSNAENLISYTELNDILSKVYTENPILLAAREELNETRELYPQARAGWLPTVTAETSIFATDIESSNFSNGDGATTKDITFNVNQPVYRGRRTISDIARAHDLISAGGMVLENIEQEMYLRVATAYLDLLRDAEILKFRKTYQGIIAEELTAAQERYNMGETTITDVHQAQSRYQQSESTLINANANLEISDARFYEIVGMRPQALIRPVSNFNFPTELNQMILMAETKNPEIRIAQFEYEAAEHNADTIFRELLPQISAFASYNKQYDPQPGIVDESQTEMIGIKATLALYQGGETRSRIREGKYFAKRQQYEIDVIRRQIKQEITSNWRSYVAAQNETLSRKLEIKATEMALEGVKEEARVGQRTILDLLDADEDLIEAKIALSRAKRNETVASYALAKSLGILNFNHFK